MANHFTLVVSLDCRTHVLHPYGTDLLGGEEVSATVEEVRPGTWRFVTDCYYSNNSELVLTITQPFVRAVATYKALLFADSELESARSR